MAFCISCDQPFELKATEAGKVEMPACRHTLAGGRPCSDVVRCREEWPLQQP
jgi:hypothetical protein